MPLWAAPLAVGDSGLAAIALKVMALQVGLAAVIQVVTTQGAECSGEPSPLLRELFQVWLLPFAPDSPAHFGPGQPRSVRGVGGPLRLPIGLCRR